MPETCPDGFWCAEIRKEKSEKSEDTKTYASAAKGDTKIEKKVVSFCGGYDIGNIQAVIVNYTTDPKYRSKGIGGMVFSKVLRIG